MSENVSAPLADLTGTTPDERAVLTGIARRFEARRLELARAALARTVELPARLLAQTSHFTTPASQVETIRKAALGVAGAARLLEKLAIAPSDLAATLGVDERVVRAVLATRGGPPLVLVDAEDATALDPAVARRSRTSAVEAFATIEWGRTLAFYRPGGLALDACVEDLVTVVAGTAARARGRRFPIDGVVWPKVEHEDELVFLGELLSELERASGLAPGTVRVGFLVESGRAVLRLERLVNAILPRLSSVIWGIADYAADVGLPSIRPDHPTCEWARAAIVNAAGAVGVPPIDHMTFDYPVRDPALDAASNKLKILGALRTCHHEARRGIELGMEGKWVGHPLQLVANEIAYRGALDEAGVARDVADVRAYRDASRAGQGAAVISGHMADRATDRHLRRRLRRAFARGVLAADVARELGVIAESELASTRSA